MHNRFSFTKSPRPRNLAIIAHVDHGKTTLVDQLLRQSGALDEKNQKITRIMDSNHLERERGITIFAKHSSIIWQGQRINLIDTPGHADFGGEVERVLSMADAVLLLVDATDGPMPQTRFVTQKAFSHGLRPMVVINKVDRPTARANWVLDQLFELFLALDANEQQLDFPIIYANALQGHSGTDLNHLQTSLTPLFERICQHVLPSERDIEAPLQLQITQMEYNNYKGIVGIGRIHQGTLHLKDNVTVIGDDGSQRLGKIETIYRHEGLERIEVAEATAGEIVMISGLEPLKISDTICSPQHPVALPPLSIDEPTISVHFVVNNSPFAGKEGKFLTSRHILERLEKEALHNVALRVKSTEDADTFDVAGRGELHLSVLIETMRREGYEFAVSRPRVIFKASPENPKQLLEPIESLTIEVAQEYHGAVMSALGQRKAEMKEFLPDEKGHVRLLYEIPSRSLLGFRSIFLTLTGGSGIIFSRFLHYAPLKSESMPNRTHGVLISNGMGKTSAYALYGLQDRGALLIGPGIDVYEGQIIGTHCRQDDLTVNCLTGKKLTNMRASGKDEALALTPALNLSLEQCLEFIAEDELLEITPKSLRIRKKGLTAADRKRTQRSKAP